MGYRSYNEVHRASGYVGLEIGGLIRNRDMQS